MQESFASIKEINFFKRNNYFLNRFKIKNSEFYKLNINFNFLNSLPRLVFELFTIIMLSIVFIYLILSEIQTQEIIKIVALFFAASFRILPSIYRIFSSIQNLKYTYQALKTLHFDYQSYKNNEQIFSNKNLEFNKKVEIIIKEFSYKNDSKNFKLENLALEIKKNQKIGIIGKSGSGKSTLLNVFSGILSNKNISLKVDDKIICTKNDLNSWQKKIGLIPQNITILDDTLKKNILFGLDPSKVSQEDILNIIKISNLSSLLSKLPDGLEQHVSEKGINFSGGELQRIAIARALIFNPEILIFDEATSALDTFTENEILNDVNNLPNKTIIMISHRINTLKFCDKVILIEEGKIKSQGSFNNFRNY